MNIYNILKGVLTQSIFALFLTCAVQAQIGSRVAKRPIHYAKLYPRTLNGQALGDWLDSSFATNSFVNPCNNQLEYRNDEWRVPNGNCSIILIDGGLPVDSLISVRRGVRIISMSTPFHFDSIYGPLLKKESFIMVVRIPSIIVSGEYAQVDIVTSHVRKYVSEHPSKPSNIPDPLVDETKRAITEMRYKFDARSRKWRCINWEPISY